MCMKAYWYICDKWYVIYSVYRYRVNTAFVSFWTKDKSLFSQRSRCITKHFLWNFSDLGIFESISMKLFIKISLYHLSCTLYIPAVHEYHVHPALYFVMINHLVHCKQSYRTLPMPSPKKWCSRVIRGIDETCYTSLFRCYSLLYSTYSIW